MENGKWKIIKFNFEPSDRVSGTEGASQRYHFVCAVTFTVLTVPN